MSMGEELLDSILYNARSSYSSMERIEGHIIIDVDRHVTVPEELKRLAVQYDHNVETVTFDCPRYWDDVDMSVMNIYINYSLPDRTLGRYAVDNIRVDESDDRIIHFDWTILRDVTRIAGDIAFLICAKRSNADGDEEVHWNSELCSSCYISRGLEIGTAESIE